ncbi:MAG TPA: hypothetical protein VNY05_11805 [Candidatus Acidoferrales bacterium]|jgi:hypothetical protein|nr:hypothetical protein [Candidatus Acidoferrales bacterium]
MTNITRRDLGRLAASGAASHSVPAAPAQPAPKIGYCMVGLGRISMQLHPCLQKHATFPGRRAGNRPSRQGRTMAAAYRVPARNIYRDPSHFVRQANHFSVCILQNKEPKTPGEEGLRDMKLIAAIHKSAGIVF